MNTGRLRFGLLLLAFCQPAAAQTPAIAANGILNAADYTGAAAPGTMLAIFGTNLAPRTTAAASVPLPVTLEGVTVEVMPPGGAWTAVPLYFVSAGQVNVQLPFVTAVSLSLRVRNAGGTSAATVLPLAARAPRIFTRTQDGKGEPTLFHARDFSWVSAAAPAAPGEYLVLLLTGLGAVAPAKAAGAPGGDNGANGPLNLVSEPVYVTFGGQETAAAFAGLMPGFPGVYQINFQVPEAIAAGAQALQVRAGAVRSQLNVAAACARYAPGAVVTVIGPAGGTLTTAGATVALPPGLVNEPSTMAIARIASGATPVDTWRASDIFMLTGLPAQLNAPVTVTLDLTGRAPSDQTLIAMDSGRGVRGAGLEFLEATVSGGQATVTLPAAETGGAKSLVTRPAESGPEVSLYVMTFYRQGQAGEFLLFYPPDRVQEADVNAIGSALATAKAQISNLGLSWAGRTRWPMRIVIYPFEGEDQEKWGMAEPSILGLNYHSISLNATKLTGGVTADWKASIGHELFHILQNLYDPRDAYRIAKFPGSWLWYQEAASTWFESIAAGDRNGLPAIVKADNYAFLGRHGLEYQPGDKAAVQNHGYGASLFLHYLAGRTGGDAVVGNILKEAAQRSQGILGESARWPVEAANSVLPGMLNEHWRNFVIAFTEGNLYNDTFPKKDEVVSMLKGRHEFTDETTAGVTFQWTAPALSAAYYAVRVRAWPKDVKMTISLTDAGGEAQLSIYRVRGETWTLVNRMRAGEFDFPKPDELVANGESLYLAVANANGSGRFTGSTAIAVGVNKTVESIVPLLKLMPKFKSQINALIQWEGVSTPQPSLMGTFFGLPGLSWNGAVFSATADDSALVTAGQPPYQATLTGTVSPDGLKIASAHFKRYRLYDRQYPDATGRLYRAYQEDTYEWDIAGLAVVVPTRGFTAATNSFLYQAKNAAAGATLSGFVCKRVFYDGLASEFTPAKLKTQTCTLSFPADDRYYNEVNFYK